MKTLKRFTAAFMAVLIALGALIPPAFALPSVTETNQYYRDTVLKNKTDRFESLLDTYKSNNQGAMVLHTYMDYLVAIMGNPYYSEDNEVELDEKVMAVLSDMYKALSASNLSFTASLDHYVDAIQQRIDELQAAYDSLGFWGKVGQFFVALGRWCRGLGWTANDEERELKTALEYYVTLIGRVDSEMLNAVLKLNGICTKETMEYCGQEPCRYADPDAVNQDYCEYHTLVYLMPHGTPDQIGKVCKKTASGEYAYTSRARMLMAYNAFSPVASTLFNVIGLNDIKCKQAKRILEAPNLDAAAAILSEAHICTEECYHLESYEYPQASNDAYYNTANAMAITYPLSRTVDMGGVNPPMNVIKERLSALATPVDFLSRWMQLEKDLFTVTAFDGDPIFNFNVEVFGSGKWEWKTARLGDMLQGTDEKDGDITAWYEEYMPWIQAIRTDKNYMEDITANVPLPYVQSLSTAALDAQVTTENGDIIAKPYREAEKAVVRTAATIQWWKALCDKFGIESKIKIMENKANLDKVDLDNLGTLGYMASAGKPNGGKKSNYWYTTDYINAGIALSALYKPLYTNIYDMPYVDMVDDYDGQFTMFINKFGRMRKAVMIEKSSGSVATYLTKGSYDKFNVCTLRDLVEHADRDKLLVVQDTYYNRHKIPAGKELFELSELNEMSGGTQSLRDIHIEAAADASMVEDASTPNEVNTTQGSTAQVEVSTIVGHIDIWRDYSFSYAKDSLNSFFEVADNVSFSKFVTGLEDDTLNIYLGLDAMVHSRQKYDKVDWVGTGDNNLYQYMKDDINRPVWLSASRDIGSDSKQNDSVHWNYMLLANVANSIAVRYTSNLDLDSPLFVDIFGNIITESGIVVIPAAANGTLNTRVNLLTAAFLLNYGKVESIKRDGLNDGSAKSANTR